MKYPRVSHFNTKTQSYPTCKFHCWKTSGHTTSKAGTQFQPSEKNKTETTKYIIEDKQGKKLEDQANEEETGKLYENKFTVMIVKKYQNIKNRMEKMKKKKQPFNRFNKDLVKIKDEQKLMNNIITEIKIV